MATRKLAASRMAGSPAVAGASRPTARNTTASHRFDLQATVSLPALLDGPQGGDRRFRQMLYDMSTAAAHLDTARAYLAAQIELTPPQYNMLMVIAQYEGEQGLSVSQVAAHLHVSNTFITSEVNKLVQGGLVTKLPNPDDARSVLLRLTSEGEARVQALQQELHFVNDQLFAQLSATDFRHLSRIIAALIPNFERTVAMLGALGTRAEQAGAPRALAALRRSGK